MFDWERNGVLIFVESGDIGGERRDPNVESFGEAERRRSRAQGVDRTAGEYSDVSRHQALP